MDNYVLTLVVASGNKKKLNELCRILRPIGVNVVSPAEAGFNMDGVEETGDTFAQNAMIKAKAGYERSGMATIADDSGLCVDALDGAPGIYSARYAGEGANDEQRCQKLLSNMQDVPDEKRTARFVSSICCILPDCVITAEQTCEGHIGYEPKGEHGFGYDPVFYIENGQSFAQLSDEQKDAISHRGKALREFAQKLKAYIEQHQQ